MLLVLFRHLFLLRDDFFILLYLYNFDREILFVLKLVKLLRLLSISEIKKSECVIRDGCIVSLQ